MTEELEPLTPEQEHARDSLRRVGLPAARADFRARLKGEFMTGSIASGTERAKLRSVLEGPRWLGMWAQPVALAAAAALIAVSVLGLNRGPAWKVSGATGEGIAIVGNRGIPMNHTDELSAALRPGVKIQVPAGAELNVMAGKTLAISVMPGTEFVLPKSPGRWFAREVDTQIKTGQLRITTGPSFRGARLMVLTPEAVVDVVGTTLAVICEPHGTCVCVLEGHVHVGAIAGEMADVEAGRRQFVFNDGRGPETDEMRPIERVKLDEFKDAMGRRMAGGKP